ATTRAATSRTCPRRCSTSSRGAATAGAWPAIESPAGAGPVERSSWFGTAGNDASSPLRLRGRRAGPEGTAGARRRSPSPVYGRRCPESLPPRKRGADEGARAQRSVLLIFVWEGATAARFARALIRRFAPPSPAAQEKGWFRTLRRELGRKPFSRSREKVPGGRMRGRERSEACF